jgi:VWFA-related protein
MRRLMRRHSLRLGLVVVMAVPVLASPQQTLSGLPQQPTFKTSTELLTLDVVVTDSHGQSVTTLAADDFEVIENKRGVAVKQAVYVPIGGGAPAAAPAPDAGSLSTSAPPRGLVSPPSSQAVHRVVAIVVDDLALSFRSIVDVRSALHKFIDTQLQPGDLVAILRTGAGMGTMQLFTTDKRLLHAAAERVQWTSASRGGVEALAPIEQHLSSPRPTMPNAGLSTPESRAENSTADAHVADKDETIDSLRANIITGGSLGTLELAVRSLQRLPGRKSVVFFSDGIDLVDMRGDPRIWSTVSRLMNSANRSGVVLYSIDARGLLIVGARAEDAELDRGALEHRRTSVWDTQDGLRYLSEQTGAFAVINNNDLNLGLQRILNDQQGYYLLGYVATDESARHWDPDQLKVRVKRPGLKVRWRRGVFGPADPASPSEVAEDPLVTATLSPFNAGAMTMRVTAMFGHAPATGSYVHALCFVDINDVHFTHTADDTYAGEIELLVVAVDASGQRVQAWRKTEPLTLNGAAYEEARKRGITFSATVSLKAEGGYQIRAAVRDTSTGAVGSSSQFVLVPKVGLGQLAISSVLMQGEMPASAMAKADEATGISAETRQQPAVRIFSPASQVTYAYEIYAGLKAEESLLTSVTLLHDGDPVYSSPAQPIAANAGAPRGKGVQVIPIGGTLSLGRDLPPGAYALRVNVIRDRPKAKTRSVAQWVDFEVR